MKKTNNNFCNNCGKFGHLYHQCKNPITSIGIIPFTKVGDEFKYLMICRKDTLGYVDFMRGRYSLTNKAYMLNILNEMTIKEKENLVTYTFDELWNKLWGGYVANQYKNEEKISSEKFKSLKNGVLLENKIYTLSDLIKESTTKWNEPEWGFPKGRRNFHEKDLDCAIREFNEETGIDNINIVYNIIPYEEIFTGSNYKSYKHKYFLGYINSNNINNIDNYQISEVSNLEWKTFDESINIIRDYNLERINILKKINTVLNKYSLYL